MYEGVVQDLIDELGRLPGVGPKSAQRIAFHLLAAEPADVAGSPTRCSRCKERGAGSARSASTSPRTSSAGSAATRAATRPCICVVEEPKDVVAIERTREFRGRYHVLGGAISPIDGIGPDDLRIRELLTRLADGTVTELILATDPNLEGEATATYLARLLKPIGLTRDPAGERAAGRRRPRVRRRGHARPRLRGPAAARRQAPEPPWRVRASFSPAPSCGAATSPSSAGGPPAAGCAVAWSSALSPALSAAARRTARSRSSITPTTAMPPTATSEQIRLGTPSSFRALAASTTISR